MIGTQRIVKQIAQGCKGLKYLGSYKHKKRKAQGQAPRRKLKTLLQHVLC